MIEKQPDDFRYRLIDTEPLHPEHKRRYDEAIESMLNRKLTAPKRWAWAGSACLGLVFAGMFGVIAVTAPGEFPLLGRLAFGAGAVFGLIWAGMAFWFVKKGAVHLKRDSTATTGLAWGATIIITTLLLVLATRVADPLVGVQIVVGVLPFLVLAATFMIVNRVEQAELRTRERLVEFEYRLCEVLKSAPASD